MWEGKRGEDGELESPSEDSGVLNPEKVGRQEGDLLLQNCRGYAPRVYQSDTVCPSLTCPSEESLVLQEGAGFRIAAVLSHWLSVACRKQSSGVNMVVGSKQSIWGNSQ